MAEKIDRMNFSIPVLRTGRVRERHRRTLFCSGYWRLPGYKKRSLTYYQERLPKTFDLLTGGSVLFWYEDEDIIDYVQRISDDRGITLLPLKLSFSDLPGREYAEDFVIGCRAMQPSPRPSMPIAKVDERGIALYWRDFVDAGEDTYRSLVSIWLSRIPLMHSLVDNPEWSDFEHFSWVDASLSRFNGRPNWDFRRQFHPASRISHYGNRGWKNGERLPLNAAYLSGGRDAWKEFFIKFAEVIDAVRLEHYANDDETVISEIVKINPGLFHRLGLPASSRQMFVNQLLRRSSRGRWPYVRPL